MTKKTYKITYESAPVSEVAKTAEVSTFDDDGLSFAEAAESINKIGRLLGRPKVTEDNIISVELILETEDTAPLPPTQED